MHFMSTWGDLTLGSEWPVMDCGGLCALSEQPLHDCMGLAHGLRSLKRARLQDPRPRPKRERRLEEDVHNTCVVVVLCVVQWHHAIMVLRGECVGEPDDLPACQGSGVCRALQSLTPVLDIH